ncbi:MAG: Mur ligase domain-containing protein [Kiritimatiellae bacterium]|nr:Mur ligase domain-containing protein [Kiritimatiellia bacterium]
MHKKRIHFMGIGGVGMAALAVLVKDQGHEVSGCDLKSSPRTDYLESLGIEVKIGHDESHVKDIDELVITPAVHDDEKELKSFEGRVVYRGEKLAEIVSSRESIAVCGSHGKTTTSTFIAKLLKLLGEDVAWAIGGETGDFPVAHAGKGVLVVEADESDGTLALYHPTILVVNKCEYDHPDHFKTEKAYFECFETAKRQAKIVIDSELLKPLELLERFEPYLALASHNRRNARAAVEVALRRGHSEDDIMKALPEAIASLPDRRFEKVTDGVYTDYAHHPTEIKCAIEMARKITKGKLRVIFQPHRYSRTRALLKSFPEVFALADEVVLAPTYAAFEPRIEGGTIADLYKECREHDFSDASGKPRFYLARSLEEAWTHAALSHEDGDLTLLLGAGDIIKLAKMAKKGEISPRRVHYIGMGSNTWKSDLRTNEVYVKTSEPAGRPGATLGIPWMVGIPGTIGGWIKMNAGAFGHEISEVLKRVKVDGVWLDVKDCGFGYRTSAIDGEIQDFELKENLEFAEDASCYLSRRKKFPAHTWGSFFKNPEGDYAGRLLEAAGAKSIRVGGAYVWEEHANVIVAGEGATPSDVLALAKLMRDKVHYRFGITLIPEVRGIP